VSFSQNGEDERKVYLDERKQLVESERDTAKTFDTSMITITSGALALSLVFVKEVAPDPKNVYVLIGAWVFFVLALLMIMSSFLTSQAATRKQRDILDCLQNDPNTSQENKDAIRTLRLNWAAIFSFLIAIVLFVIFAGLNIQSKTKGEIMPKAPSFPVDHRGYIPPRTPAADPNAGVVPPRAPLPSAPLPTAPPPQKTS
jgi:hypothetical protein